jgi:cysteine desulfurase
MEKKRIYLDNCVTTKPDPQIFDVMKEYWENEYWFPANFFTAGEEINAKLNDFKAIFGKTINAKADEIHFTRGGTSANNIAIKGILMANSQKGTHIICSVVDYPDILTNYAFFEKSGFEVTYLQPDEQGLVSAEKLKAAIRPDTILFSTTWVNHVVGTIQPMEEYTKVLQDADHKIYLHVDAGQAYGKFPIDMDKVGIDTMSVSGHKIHGPQGVGFLYKRTKTPLAQVVHGVNRVDNLETGGINVGSLAGFAKAAEITFADLAGNTKKIRDLSNYLLNRLVTEIPDVELNGAPGEGRACHNINVSIDYIEGEAMGMMLDLQGITAATGSACASQGLKPSYVLMAMGKNHMQSHGSMKFTLSKYTTKDELDITVDKLKEIVVELRRRSPLYQEKK